MTKFTSEAPSSSTVVNGTPQQNLLGLTFGCIGVVYGDIGTSPLYAFREAVHAAQDTGPLTQTTVLGVLSLILWSLVVVVTLKYVLILLRADNNGEGGTLSLTALARRALGRRTTGVLLLGTIGASMFLGDSVITPAISVLSAVEGLKLVTTATEHYVIVITLVILFTLFFVQRRGTASVAALFGPVMTVWFIAIAIAGAIHIRDHPDVLLAVSPYYAVDFMLEHRHVGLITLGLVFLAVTGGEALYADLGHFGRRPIQTAWLFLVLPSLLINYFGQGARVLSDPAAIENPFYRLVPGSLILPMVALATAATVIASQAVITGAFSLVRQAIQLGFLPRLAIIHTSDAYSGQIYIPRVNTALLLGVLLLVGLFRTSSALASAYGIAVATTMVVDGALGFVVIWALVASGTSHRSAGNRRRNVFLGKPSEGARGCLAAAIVWHRHGASHHHLAPRHGHSRQKNSPLRSQSRQFSTQSGAEAATRRSRNGNFPYQRSRVRANGAAAQS